MTTEIAIGVVALFQLDLACSLIGHIVSLYVRSRFTMNRRGRSKPQFLARLPSSDLFQWIDTRVCKEQGAKDKLLGTKSLGATDLRVQDQLPTVVAAGVTCLESSEGRADRKKRSGMPVV